MYQTHHSLCLKENLLKTIHLCENKAIYGNHSSWNCLLSVFWASKSFLHLEQLEAINILYIVTICWQYFLTHSLRCQLQLQLYPASVNTNIQIVFQTLPMSYPSWHPTLWAFLFFHNSTREFTSYSGHKALYCKYQIPLSLQTTWKKQSVKHRNII